MLSVEVYDNTTWELNFWIGGLETLAHQGVVKKLTYRRGRDCPVPPSRGVSLTLSARAGDSPPRFGYIDIRDGYEEINSGAFAVVSAYFKVNYNTEYLQRHLARDEFSKVSPLGFWIPIRLPKWYGVPLTLLKRLRAAAGAEKVLRPRAVYRDLRYNLAELRLPRLEYLMEVLAHRSERRFDLFWKVNAWKGELTKASAQRLAVMKVLDRVRASTSFRLEYGFRDSPTSSMYYSEYVLRTPSTRKAYHQTLARSKIGIVTRGLKDSLNWSIGEHLAMRRFVLCERHLNTTYRQLENGRHVVFFESDLSDLEEKVRYYLTHSLTNDLLVRRSDSDITVLWQVFGERECDVPLARPPRFIVDGGAYVGYTSVYFASRYPEALVIAVEPARENCQMLVENCRAYRNIEIVKAGLWNSNADLKIYNPGGKSWAFRVSQGSAPSVDSVSGVTIPELLARHEASEIDILKLDIEGAEEFLFDSDSRAWISKVRAIVIEVHGKKCDEIVHRAIAGQDFEESRQGEKLVFTRIPRDSNLDVP